MIVPMLQPNDAVIVMSNGGFGGIHRKLLNALAGKTASSGQSSAFSFPTTSK